MSSVTVYGIAGEDGRIRYVGQTTGDLKNRLCAHLSAAYRRQKTPLARWLRKLIVTGGTPAIFVIERDATLHLAEQRLIAWYRRHGARLLNVTDGGEGTLGCRFPGRKRPDLAARNRLAAGKPIPHLNTPETIAKISAASKGKPRPYMVARNRATAGKPGHRHTPESRAKISAAHKGRTLTPAWKLKLSVAAKRRWRGLPEQLAQMAKARTVMAQKRASNVQA